MENCIHELVCKHKRGDDSVECSLKDICKFLPAGEVDKHSRIPGLPKEKRKYKKREKRALPLDNKKDGRGRSQGDYSYLTTSDKDIRRGRQILLLRQDRGSLTENQSAALDMYKDIKPKKLTPVQRQQVLDILNDVQKRE